MTEAANNVVVFPSDRAGILDPLTIDDIRRSVENIRITHVEVCLDAASECLIDTLVAAGFEVDDDTMVKDMALAYSAIKSMMLKSKGVYHPLQTLSEMMFDYDIDGNVTMSPDLSVTVAKVKEGES